MALNVYGPAYPSQQIKTYFEAFMPLDQLDQSGPTCQILAGPVGPVGPDNKHHGKKNM
jgi:folate-dependent tRNA-U54 methylase TrmFO/GidA